MRSHLLVALSFSWLTFSLGCASDDGDDPGPGGSGGLDNAGGTAAGGLVNSGGQGSGTGAVGSGGGPASGGQFSTGGHFSTGGVANSGGAPGGGGPSGGASSGGSPGGGSSSGGAASGGAGTGGGLPELDCNASMPSSGAQQHSGNGVGGEDNLAWEIWSNTGMGELTTYDVPAFTASWNEAGGYLGRLGYEWGGFMSNPVPYDQHGEIVAQFASEKSGTAGIYSYVGMYGWSTDPCVEWYIVEDSFNNMPINPGNTTNEGEVMLDDGEYIMYTRPTTGTGGTRCSGVNEWIQYYSVRKTARQCGTISLTKHFDAWAQLGMPLGDLLEAKILVEVGGGVGKVDLPVANVVELP